MVFEKNEAVSDDQELQEKFREHPLIKDFNFAWSNLNFEDRNKIKKMLLQQGIKKIKENQELKDEFYKVFNSAKGLSPNIEDVLMQIKFIDNN